MFSITRNCPKSCFIDFCRFKTKFLISNILWNFTESAFKAIGSNFLYKLLRVNNENICRLKMNFQRVIKLQDKEEEFSNLSE